MTNIDSVLKSREITLPIKVHIIKAMVFPVVSNRCESCTLKKAGKTNNNNNNNKKEGRAPKNPCFKQWCWRRLLRVSWTARSSNLSI